MNLLAAITLIEFETAPLAAWTVTAAALAFSAVGRRLPPGMGEGLFVGGLSGGLLLLNAAALANATDPNTLAGASLVSLAVVWLLVALWVERAPGSAAASGTAAPGSSDTGGTAALGCGGPSGTAAPGSADIGGTAALGCVDPRRAIRSDLALHATLAAAMLGLAALLSGDGPDTGLTLVRVLLLGLLLALGVAVRIWRPGPFSRYPLIGGLVVVVWIAHIPLPVSDSRLPLLLLALGLLALLATLACVLVDWRRRVWLWRTAPERLVESARRHGALFAPVIVTCAAVGLAALRIPFAAPTAVAVFFAAYAALIVGHCRASVPLGEFGLVLAAEAICLASLSWLPAAPGGGFIGLGLAGAYFLWVARFWSQQLDEGRAWTTSGRLIPSARRLGYLIAAVELAAAGLLALRGAGPTGGWGLAAGLVLLLHWTLLVGDAARENSVPAALVSWFSLLAALFALRGAVTAWVGVELPPAVVLTAAALFGAARVPRASAETAWVQNAHVAGLLPVLALYDFTWGGSSARPATGVAAGMALLLVLALRWRGWRAGR